MNKKMLSIAAITVVVVFGLVVSTLIAFGMATPFRVGIVTLDTVVVIGLLYGLGESKT